MATEKAHISFYASTPTARLYKKLPKMLKSQILDNLIQLGLTTKEGAKLLESCGIDTPKITPNKKSLLSRFSD